MQIPIVADFDKEVATSYGVLLPGGIPLRALFIIDPTGALRQITCNDLPVGRNVDEILRLIKAFQFVEKYGEVCPANWQPGDATIDTANSKDYFKAANDGASSSERIAEESAVLDVSDKAAFTTLIGASTLTVVDYWAPWCRNCKKISPTISRLAAEFPGVQFAKVNTVECEEIAVAQGIDALPTFQFFKDGKEVGTFKGSDSAAVEKEIRSYM
eukprot:CAMPEP_0119051062 /NCGR_PEP_ID=MMETSP1177-20130426/72806_1 /TAXON_ID=2985 /ORGANISM="Ochromonas sp, Strain CCMP1899" /LENGTH=213 /DNA_ID=CAMNT_0007030143 /DNA_START=338 /DNA_END=979 /DNA_ORIENTATION=+